MRLCDGHRPHTALRLSRHSLGPEKLRADQYWRVENLKSFDEFLERRFPESRRKAYYQSNRFRPGRKRSLPQPGYDVLAEDGQHFDCAIWLHKARKLSKEDFRREVEKELTGGDRTTRDHVSRSTKARSQ